MPVSESVAAVSYLRVSGLGQVRGDGFERQRTSIAHLAKANGYRLVDEFRDDGISGVTELANRPGLAALLDRVESNHVRCVLVENASRLARDLMVQEVVLAQFRKAGAAVIAADGGTDLTVADGDPTRKLIRQVLGAVAEFEKSTQVLKLRAARERIRRRTGHCEGPKPYGSYPGETKLLAEMQRLRRKPSGGKRRSYEEIATALNSQGAANRAGRPWSARMVFHTLKTAAARKQQVSMERGRAPLPAVARAKGRATE
jgi:DNA invertase Pin-like site-specific DNA recombinase